MTGILVALLGVLWMVVLLPVLFGARQNTSIGGSVGTFNRGMRALSSNHSQPSLGGRLVLTPRTPDDEADRKLLMLRRRRLFSFCVGALGFTLLLGLLPSMRGALWLALLSALVLGGYTAFLIQEKQRTPVHQRLAELTSERRLDDVPTVLRLAYTPPAPAPPGTRRIHTIVDESLEDDGLGELSWLKAGRY